MYVLSSYLDKLPLCSSLLSVVFFIATEKTLLSFKRKPRTQALGRACSKISTLGLFWANSDLKYAVLLSGRGLGYCVVRLWIRGQVRSFSLVTTHVYEGLVALKDGSICIFVRIILHCMGLS